MVHRCSNVDRSSVLLSLMGEAQGDTEISHPLQFRSFISLQTKDALTSARAEHAQLTESAVLLEASVDLRSTLLEMLQAAQQACSPFV